MTFRMRYILAAGVLAVFCVAAALLSRSDKAVRRMLCCSDVDLTLTDTLGSATVADLLQVLEDGYGCATGQRLDSVCLYKIEDLMRSHPSVLDCQAWTTGDGILHISVENRAPVALLRKGRAAAYLDGTGYLIPIYSGTVAVPEITGDIPLGSGLFKEGADGGAWAQDIVALMQYISDHGLWGDMVTGIRVNRDSGLEMRSARGPEKIIFGEIDNFESKFGRIERYMSEIAPLKGPYKSVNVKFNNQIICRKDI